MRRPSLDAIDIRILGALQAHGPLSKTRLAALVDLSPTPCWTRLGRLKAAGFIRGYRADLALDRIVDFTQVIVTLSLAYHRRSDFDRFETHIRGCAAITECIATGGGTDYVLRFFSPSLSDFQAAMDSLLSAELGIERYVTYIVTRTIKSGSPDLTRLTGRRAGR